MCHLGFIVHIMDGLGSSAQFAYQLCWIYAFLFYIYVKRCNKFSYYIPVRINVKVTILYKSYADVWEVRIIAPFLTYRFQLLFV
ncbi:hypothetical protein SAMN05216311_11861 [Chitinophaga sp. CF418]|nr:hypothetical protein SAMN05216311_11861 [Chitinophaga sp. CF418]